MTEKGLLYLASAIVMISFFGGIIVFVVEIVG